MASCLKASRLISESHERRLSIWEKIDLGVHLGICTACRKYRRQVRLLRRLLREAGERLEDAASAAGGPISEEARMRIRSAIERVSLPPSARNE